MAIKIGITGGIGSGKSMVSRLLEVLGVPVYISDLETKRLMASDSLIREDLSALLGAEVYAGGTLNKPLLASYLFGSPEHAKEINWYRASLRKGGFQAVDTMPHRFSHCRYRIGRFWSKRGLRVKWMLSLWSMRPKRCAFYVPSGGCFLARIDRKAYP